MIQIDSFSESWEFLQHTAKVDLSYTTPAGVVTKYTWDGTNLVIDGDASSTYSAQNATQSARNATTSQESAHPARSNTLKDGAEVFELLNALKWFEYNFIKTQMMLESEVYSFDTAEQHKRELDRKMEAAEKKDKEPQQNQFPIDPKEL